MQKQLKNKRQLRTRSGILIVLAVTFVAASFFMAGYWLSRVGAIPNFAEIQNFQRRQQVFVAFLLPKICRINRLIVWQRRNAQQMHVYWLRNGRLTRSSHHWIEQLAQRYQISQPTLNDSFWSHLLLRVDVIPPGLALAQAANESGWGTSRFAQQGNNLFGQWCFTAGCGLVPRDRQAGAQYEVKAFKTVRAAVRAYVYNLNTNAAYQHLRLIRQQLRVQGLPLSSTDLAAGLDQYSQKGAAYAQLIQSIIVQYHLKQYDSGHC